MKAHVIRKGKDQIVAFDSKSCAHKLVEKLPHDEKGYSVTELYVRNIHVPRYSNFEDYVLKNEFSENEIA